ncbi:MAG: MFS transporter [archaeon]|nr:MAG: MFS transporter [archaeon]
MKRWFFNKALRILLITNGLILIAGAMLGPIFAIFAEQVGGNILEAGIAGGLFALAAGVTTLISGKYADKMRRDEKIIIWGYVLMGAGFVLYIFVNSVWFLFAVQIVVGIGEAIYSPAFDALYSRHITVKKAGREWGLWESMNYFTAAGGAALGGFIASRFGFHPLFVIMAALCFGSAIYLLQLKKNVL